MTGAPTTPPFETLAARFAAIEARDMAELSAWRPGLAVQEIALDMSRSTPSFFDELAAGLTKGRRGEVLLIIRHRDGRLWVHTKETYPAGVYRLPTGGIGEQEAAQEAARRELWEEAGLRAESCACTGILRYRLRRGDRSLPFISYLFDCAGGEQSPAPQDDGERISDFRLVSPADLPAIAHSLRQVGPPRWQDWGHFRALAHEFLAGLLQG